MALRMRWLAAAVVALSGALQAQLTLPAKKILTLEAARILAAGAAEEAARNKWTMVIAVVDDGGHLLLLERMNNAQTGSIEVALQKAKTAIAFKRATKTFEDRTLAGRTVLLGLPGVVPIDGGIPVIVDGHYLGAIGISGGSSEQDGLAAKAAVDTFYARSGLRP